MKGGYLTKNIISTKLSQLNDQKGLFFFPFSPSIKQGSEATEADNLKAKGNNQRSIRGSLSGPEKVTSGRLFHRMSASAGI